MRLSLSCALIWALCGVVSADEAFCPSVVATGAAETANRAKSVFVVGELAYVADGFAGLQIYAIGDATQPTLVGGVDTNGRASDVVVVGDVCFVADASGGLDLIDISDPSVPVQFDERSLGGAVAWLDVEGDMLIVGVGNSAGTGYRAVQLFDIQATGDPVLLSTYEDVCVMNDLALDAGRVYIACDDVDSILLDVSDPAEPVFVRSISNSRGVESLDAAGDLLVIGDAFDVFVFDARDIQQLDELYSYQAKSLVQCARIWGDDRVLLSTEDAIVGIDIEDPARPLFLFSEPLSDVGLRVAGEGDRVVGALDGSGIVSLDTSGLRSPVIASLVTPGSATSIAVGGGFAFVGQGSSGIEVFDVGVASQPALVGGVGTGGAVLDLELRGSWLYAASVSSFEVFDVSDPSEPRLVSSIPTPDFSIVVRVVDGTAYVLSEQRRLDVVDVSDPVTPLVMGTYSFPGVSAFDFTFDFVVDGQYAYVAGDGSGLIVLDVGGPGSIAEVARIDVPPENGTPSAYSIDMYDGRLLVSTSFSGPHLAVFDVADPLSPMLMSVQEADANAFVFDGEIGYASGGGMKVFDFSDPDVPLLDQRLPMLAGTTDLALVGEMIYLCNSDHGVRVVDVSGCADCPGDLTGDGVLNFFDVSAFLGAFFGGDVLGDWNKDGVWNFFDVSGFLTDFQSGCP